jgi:hypothetical protein
MKSLKVELTRPSPHLVADFRHFGEDVYNSVRDVCRISLDEIDAATNVFYLHEIKPRSLRGVAATVRKIAVKHRMTRIVEIAAIASGKRM